MRNIYHKVFNGNGLSIGIDREGVTIKEMTPVKGLIEEPEGNYLITESCFVWSSFFKSDNKAVGCYSNDNGKGKTINKIIARSISLMSYWGGEESFIDNLKEFDKVGE